MQIITLGSYPIEQERDLDGRERRGGGWFAARTYPTRLLTLSGAFNMRPAIAPLQRELRDLTALARLVPPCSPPSTTCCVAIDAPTQRRSCNSLRAQH